jgi:ATP-dependent protease ClpP protease subunit
MIHEPAKWAGWQSTTAAAQHLERLRQMQDQIYQILASRAHRPLKQIIKDTKRTDFYLDARRALAYGMIDAIVEPMEERLRPPAPSATVHPESEPSVTAEAAAAPKPPAAAS